MAYPAGILSTLRQRWRSGVHVGAKKPVMRGYVRVVRLDRAYRQVPWDEVYCQVPGLDEGRNQVWKGLWVPQTGWQVLPNIQQCEGDQDWQQDGIGNFTVTMDNVAFVQASGLNGIYHVIKRGYYAPFRGHDGAGHGEPGEANQWGDYLSDKSANIIILAGYGDTVVPIAEGLVNDADIDSKPDKIVLHCRDGGQVLTDQRVFLNAKIRRVRDPITFADRREAEGIVEEGAGAAASSHTNSHPPRLALDDRNGTFWESRQNSSAGAVEWLQLDVPPGDYRRIRVTPEYSGMSMWIAVKARDRKAPGGEGARRLSNGSGLSNDEWVDEGMGNAPGTSIPIVGHIPEVAGKEREYDIPGYRLGEGSTIRIFFSNLHKHSHTARVNDFVALRSRPLGNSSEIRKWIIVDDIADVVRCVLQWAGLNDWEIETTGVRLKDKVVFNRGDFLIDIIKKASEQVGYVFYMKPRETFDESPAALASIAPESSMGIAVWRYNQAQTSQPLDPVELVHEDQVLQRPSVKISDEPLAYNIRVRGKELRRRQGGLPNAGERTLRAHYNYRPPWSRDDDFRNANIKKYVVHHELMARNTDECKIAALFIALREALESAQVSWEMPAMPTIHLDHQTALFDTATGISSRVWIATRSFSFRSGEDGHFKMGLGGSLLDLPDTLVVREELQRALADNNYNPGLSQWEIEHHGEVYFGE